ncbi:MAG TPA: hypothetical protein VJ233_11985 [Hyphomicrobiaceae bacterium]|nr:hypothetical protein [Hyphomicrobiaceae bacterium]
MKAAVLEKPVSTGAFDIDRVRAILLVRIASASDGVSKAELVGDLAPLAAHRLPAGHWRALIEREVAALADAGLIASKAGRIAATEAGVARAAIFLGLKGSLPRSWGDVRDVRLVAKALGLEREGAKRLKALATPEGLRAAVLQQAYNLRIKGVPTASRLRSALAAVALERAFGNKVQAGLAGKLGLSAKAGRLLAGQLSRRPRDFGTDRRLVAALAAEHADAAQTDHETLRLALLRRFIEESEPPAPEPKRKPAAPTLARPRPVPVPVERPAEVAARPDLAGFAQEVRRHAAGRAQGWQGDRKAYISHVWHHIRDGRPDWGLSEIEFKCMLAEAHRAGHVVLANADLKDDECAKDLQESALIYKNAVFHFIRVDG